MKVSLLEERSPKGNICKILKLKKNLTKVSGITIPTWESNFQGLFKAEGEISDKLLDEQTLGNHDYCFSNWKCTGHLNEPITLEEITEEALKFRTGKAAGPDGITNTSRSLMENSCQMRLNRNRSSPRRQTHHFQLVYL